MPNSTSVETRNRPLLIVAEDDLDDQLLIKDALADNGMGGQDFLFVNDGDELLKALPAYRNRPAIIMLDLNMPKMDGREALQEIKKSEDFKHIPVIIFTTSSAVEDIKMTYQSGSNTFFTKPTLYAELVDLLGLIIDYWFEKAEFCRAD